MTQYTRDELLEHWQSVRADLMNALDGLTEAQMLEPTAEGEWSIKDYLAHVTVWDEVRLSEIARVGGGWRHAWAPMESEQVNAFNNLTADARRHLPLAQVMSELQATHERLMALLRTVNERAFDDSLYGESGPRSMHDREHAQDIRAWRARRGI